MRMPAEKINWDEIPDEELYETLMERIQGLKEMFPEKLRVGASSTMEWSGWLAKKSLDVATSAVWIASVTSMIMLLPYYFHKEMYEMEMEQLKQQQQMLLGPPAL